MNGKKARLLRKIAKYHPSEGRELVAFETEKQVVTIKKDGDTFKPVIKTVKMLTFVANEVRRTYKILKERSRYIPLARLETLLETEKTSL